VKVTTYKIRQSAAKPEILSKEKNMKQHPQYSNILVSQEGEIYSNLSGKNKKLKTSINEHGYEICCITLGQGKSIKKRVHRLVAETYLPNPLNLREVDHLDCDKLNNNLSNLEWVSSKENKRRARINGLYDNSVGENHYGAILTEDVVRGVCKSLQEGMRNKDVCDIYGVDKDTVAHIKRGDIWKTISREYNLSVKRNNRKSVGLIKALCSAIQKGKSNREIFDDFDGKVKISEIQRIRSKKIHTKISDSYF
tara:strand:- start:36 stop:791 length:756 start_codon:yes stop_codon:yes gene_type:complete